MSPRASPYRPCSPGRDPADSISGKGAGPAGRRDDVGAETPHAMRPFLPLLLVVVSLPAVARAADDVVVADFEAPDYAGWVATGDAFGTGPARGALPGQMSVSGYLGRGLVNTFLNGDKSKGTLTSPEFAVNRDYLT